MRGELLGIERLEQLAVSLAEVHRAEVGPGRAESLPARLEANRSALLAMVRTTSEAMRNGKSISFAGEWILDNFHIIQEQLRESAEDLPRKYYLELPKLVDGEFAGLPRVYALAVNILTHTDGRLELETLSRFVRAYQTVRPLTIGELWAVPIALRLALLENLARLAARVEHARFEIEAADSLVDELISVSAEGEVAVRAAIDKRIAPRTTPSTTMFAAEMLQRLRDQDAVLNPAIEWLEQRLADQGTSVDETLRLERQTQAADQVSVGNAISSMRAITAAVWTDFFENLSVVDAVLREDPAGVYATLDLATRDTYRRRVERIAKRTAHDEGTVCRLAVEMARDAAGAPDGDERRSHVGYYLVGDGLLSLERTTGYRPSIGERIRRTAFNHSTATYLGAIGLLTAALLVVAEIYAQRAGASAAGMVAVGLLGFILASDLAVSFVNHALTMLLEPRVLPKLDFSDGIPIGYRTIVVVPMLFSSEDDVRDTLDKLEIRFLANEDLHLHYAVLSDFADAASSECERDAELIKLATRGIEELNARYGADRFFLFHRHRLFNAVDGVWMGWERKRGKLEEFNRLLAGDKTTSFSTVVGDTSVLPGVRFAITLDADTSLPVDSARELVGTLAHPLNRARIDERTGRVVEGYGIIQPRVSVSLEAYAKTRFSGTFSGYRGVDPYTTAVSDVYQDLFGEGSFVGKGIYDVRAFARALEGRVPENALLSHDLFEGCYARTALATDIELFDDYPSRYDVFTKRRHRWIRGDWQLLPWLLPRTPSTSGRQRNVLPLIAKWKIFDNLRRSLVGPMALLFLAAAWTMLPGSPLVWTLASVLVIAFPVYAHLATAVMNTPRRAMLSSYFRSTWEDVRVNTSRIACALAFHPHQVWSTLDAIARTLWRLLVSRRRMLEWVTAAESERGSNDHQFVTAYRAMLPAIVITFGVAVAMAATRPDAFVVAWPFLAMWLASPALAVWLSKPEPVVDRPISSDDARLLRAVARSTWRYFEQFTVEAEHWLPADNFQETPTPVVARRTSPTNMGMALLANVAARDLGYIGLLECVERVQRTLGAMEKLERFRGHFYNWYDTTTLAALTPRYVSMVDSGNLAGLLLVLRQACLEALDRPLLGADALRGLEDAVAQVDVEISRLASVAHWAGSAKLSLLRSETAAFRANLAVEPGSLGQWIERLDTLERLSQEITDTVEEVSADRGARDIAELGHWAAALAAQIRSHRRDLNALAPWAMVLRTAPKTVSSGVVSRLLGEDLRGDDLTIDGLLGRAERLGRAITELQSSGESMEASALSWMDRLFSSASATVEAASECLTRLGRLADELDAMVDEMDFRCLFDTRRKLFAIGMNVETGTLDNSYYDLLASEARLGSFVAIAKGDVPAEHWHKLGRAMTNAGGGRSLMSWSGSMFEYLMPSLVMRTYEGTLLDRTCRAAVREQIAYAKRLGVPWGISEAAYNARDLQLNYQYGPFGVSELGIKRGLAENLVVAPYASLLSLAYEPTVAANLRRLEDLGAAGRFGFYESIDYTPSRVPKGARFVIVRTFMAHHQGMSLIALDEHLLGNRMKARFHSEPRVRAYELLLYERSPRLVSSAKAPDEILDRGGLREPEPDVSRYFESTQASTPRVNLLSNGSYSVMLTTAGGGYSHRGALAMTRWREDVTRDNWGQFCYLRDARSGDVWSTTYQPTLVKPSDYSAVFSLEKAEYRRVDFGIESHTTISVSTEDDAEVRVVKLTNLTAAPREIEVTSYAEVVLATPAADNAHPAFSNLFVQTEFKAGSGAILATRRQRSATDAEVWCIHVSAVDGETVDSVQYETDRSRFLGRNCTTVAPTAVVEGRPLSDTAGPVLDPIISLRRRIRLGPHAVATVLFTTAFAGSREHAEMLGEKYADAQTAARASDLAWTHAQVGLRHLGMSAGEAQVFLRLASRLLYINPDLRARPELIARNRRGQSGLWAYGISGDVPIVIARISEMEHLPLVRQLLRAHELWRLRGLEVDFVVLNEHPTSYQQELQDALLALVRSSLSAGQLDKRGGVFVRRADLMPEEDRTLLLTVARAVLVGGRGTLAQQIERKPKQLDLAANLILRRTPARFEPVSQPQPDLDFWNGTGGFSKDGREYVIVLADDRTTPAPWSNVIANPRAGFLVTESGGGYTWAENSRENRLTSWSNDPVSDPVSEAIYVRDDESGVVWTPTPLPIRTRGNYVVRHGQGYTAFAHAAHGIATELAMFVPEDDPVKLYRLTLRNLSGQRRRLSVMSFSELVLGVSREMSAPFVVTEIDEATGALLARNPYNNEFAQRVAFADSTPRPTSVTGERKEFIGRNGSLARPNALIRVGLSGQVGAGYDPCAALHVALSLEAGAETEIVFALGEGADLAETRALIARYREPDAVSAAFERARTRWDDILGAIQIETPDRALDLLVNRWLLYQAIGCRVWARAAFYQSSGAYGFRDQLQDVAAAVYALPAIAREQIVRAASRQFVEGDVQHWWHPPTGRGVRTRSSDDLLWLPFIAAHYAEVTGDTEVFDEPVGFIESRLLAVGEDDAYLVPDPSSERASLYEHCVRAIDRSLPTGEHGIPLMGNGDWNDGMNRVGREGKGESIWVGWFLSKILKEFAAICEARGDRERSTRYKKHAATVVRNIEKNAWDGEWYLRAFFDDGSPLGSASNDECRIDSIAQSWSVISGGGSKEHQVTAMASVDRNLVRSGDRLVMLFTPPLDRSPRDPGYTKGYLPGVRENGGQYTHAALWVVQARALLGDGDRAGELLALLNPVNHATSKPGVYRYKVEPYVVAGDVYAVPPHTGRGGWTWYTGSASLMYRVAVESILGFTKKDRRLQINPCVPRSWPGFAVAYRHGASVYRITVENPAGVCRGVASVELDGRSVRGNWIDLEDDGRDHSIRVVMGEV